MKIVGIYKITSPTGKIYVGQSCNIHKRWQKYKRLACKQQTKLFRSLNKYLPENHIFEIIEECEFKELNNRERYYQEFYNVIEIGLNCVLTETEHTPKILSEQTKEKLRIINTGNKHTEETKKKMSKSHTGMKRSKKHCENIKKSLLNIEISEETKIKIGLANKGKKRTEEQKIKFSLIRTGLNKKGRFVINTETKEIWDSIKKCAEDNNFKYDWFKKVLTDKIKNKTTFKYYIL